MLTAMWIFSPLAALFLHRESKLGRSALAALIAGVAFLTTAALTYRAAVGWVGDRAGHDIYFVNAHAYYFAQLGLLYAALALPLWAIHRWPVGHRWSPRLFIAFHVAVILTILPSRALLPDAMPRHYVEYSEAFRWISLSASAGATVATLALMAITLLGLFAGWRLFRSRRQS